MTRPEHRLERLLAELQPVLDPTEYAFVLLGEDHAVPEWIEPLATFREDEGTTLIVTAGDAEAQGWKNRFACRRVTLRVHSALGAVGMLASVANWLAEADIPCNVFAAVSHDHLFVPSDRGEEAIALLQARSRDCTRN